MSSPSPVPSTWHRRLGPLNVLEWLFVSAIVVLTAGAIFFAYRFVTATDPAPLPTLSDVVRDGPRAHGYLISAADDKVVLELGNGQRREFAVRPQERDTVGLPHLESHAGARDLGFIIYYRTDAGGDYIVGAAESGVPAPGQG